MLSAAELAAMQDTQEDAMMDTGVILRYASTETEYNLLVETYTPDASGTACGFDGSPGKEVLDQVPMSEAVIRMPLATSVDAKDRVKITHRFGVAEAEPLTYEFVGLPKSGPSGLRLWVRKVTDGSDE